ncbi:hypothetical protein [Octadecabacter ascidiaceicola]|uniref:Uncharacterized protein n=1 Tax=Octadecabacter ascidiaceicola TaxID=1655543 RepID=A0A238JU18_9RHOB|nr:hypothetical protein [Octadecabacter ascidiaceicola]SMX33687.1 hypothetical protein OCA8868_01001 [Octadecabacter ascidiaceicola]
MTGSPRTLREKLTAKPPQLAADKDGWSAHVWYLFANALVLTGLTVLPLLWAQNQSLGWWLGPAFLGLLLLWAFIAWVGPRSPKRHNKTGKPANEHFLLSHDQNGFMGALELDAKTAVFDGSNLYHFGVDQGIGTQPVRLIAQQLRREGYRIVSFFDANIFYTLIENGDYPAGQRHEQTGLRNVFGLAADETYIVPSGVQADKYILSSLKHLPVSFAISNDQFRDYAKVYGDLMKGNLWRKSVSIEGHEIRLTQHRFKTPLRINLAA